MGAGIWGSYVSAFSNWLSNGAFINKTSMSSLGIKPLYDRIITKSSVKKVLLITSFPTQLDTNFTSVLNRKISNLHPKCNVLITTDNFKSDLHTTFRGNDFRKNMSYAEDRVNNYEQGLNSLTETERTTGKKLRLPGGGSLRVSTEELKRLKDLYGSYKYVSSSIKGGLSMLNSYVFVEMIAPDNKEMTALFETVDDILVRIGCSYSEIKNANSKYLSSMSPTGYFYKTDTDKNFMNNLLSSENLSYLMPYMSNGFIGDGTGTLMGVDMGARAPFILNFFKTSDRQINAFIVPAGKGKTVTSLMISMFLIGQGIHCSAFDIKGEEWSKLSPFVDLNVIDISSVNGCYVNTMRLDDIIDLINPDSSDALMFFDSAVNSTIEVVKIMSSYNEGTLDYPDASAIISHSVSRYFSNNGVKNRNYKTFENTRNLNYKDLINFINKAKEVKNFESKIDIIDSIVSRCTSFMESNTIFDGREITVKDVLDKPLNIYSLNKNRDGVGNDILDSIRTFMFTYLDMKKIYIRKSKKLGTACFYEELQRKEEFKRLIVFINAIVTGARSSNVTVFLLCNNPSTLLSEELSGITSNISTYIVGNVAKSDFPVLEQLGLADLIPRIEEMTANPEKYNHCFACKFDTGDERDTCIFTSMIPPRVLSEIDTRDRQG